MGQIAEDMLDGSCCSLCGCYFKHKDDGSIYTHGYPMVLCWSCWNDLTKKEQAIYQLSDVDTF